MTAMRKSLLVGIAAALVSGRSLAFVVVVAPPSANMQQRSFSSTTRTSTSTTTATTTTTTTTTLFIEKWVADMIDQELWREEHKAEFERAWMEKNRGAVLRGLQQGNGETNSNMMLTDDTMMDMMEARQKIKDTKLARENPQQYCADRCIATGHCDVYEDL